MGMCASPCALNGRFGSRLAGLRMLVPQTRALPQDPRRPPWGREEHEPGFAWEEQQLGGAWEEPQQAHGFQGPSSDSTLGPMASLPRALSSLVSKLSSQRRPAPAHSSASLQPNAGIHDTAQPWGQEQACGGAREMGGLGAAASTGMSPPLAPPMRRAPLGAAGGPWPRQDGVGLSGVDGVEMAGQNTMGLAGLGGVGMAVLDDLLVLIAEAALESLLSGRLPGTLGPRSDDLFCRSLRSTRAWERFQNEVRARVPAPLRNEICASRPRSLCRLCASDGKWAVPGSHCCLCASGRGRAC